LACLVKLTNRGLTRVHFERPKIGIPLKTSGVASIGAAADSRMEEILKEFPKAELHLHLEGTLEPELLLKLAKRNGVPIGHKTLAEIRKSYKFSDLQSFLGTYYAAMKALQTTDDFYDLTAAYLRRAASDGVKHAEVFFDPQAHTGRGVKFGTVVSGISKALAESERSTI